MHLWLGLHAFTAKGAGSVPGQGTKIPQPRSVAKNKVVRYVCKYLCMYTYIYTYIFVYIQMYTCIHMNIIQ